MIISTSPTTGQMTVSVTPGMSVPLNHDEQRELLEALAKAQGFTLVDREERKSLMALTEEVDNDYDSATTAWATWQDRAEALAAAVNGLFQEV